MAHVNKDLPICITGITGFIASHIAEQLLESGYKVNGTVRDLEKKESFQHLLDMPNAAENLKLFQATLLAEGDYDEAINGCEIVLHTASPYILNVTDPQKDLVDPALQGTKSVLKSCQKAKVKQVILTSSIAAVTDSPEPGHKYTEADWNTTSSLSRNPYYFSKTLAERAAWDFVENLPEEEKFKLVVINPFVVIGPTHIQRMNPSNATIQQTMSGEFAAIIDIGWGFVDVRDVARSHILAFETENSNGRYLCCNETVPMTKVVEFLKKKYPNFPLPTKELTGGFGSFMVKMLSYFQPSGTGQYIRTNIGRHPDIDHTKLVNELGLEFTDVWKSIEDTAEDLIKKGHVKPIQPAQ